MAKELPFFKFEASAWDNGKIQICSRESKGLFIDICSMYWGRVGELPYKLVIQKLCNGNASALQELVDEQIIGIENDLLVIEFLDEQLSEFQDTSEKRRKAANKRWKNASAMQVHSKSNAIREEKRREEEKRESIVDFTQVEISIWPTFEDFWDKYDKKVGKSMAITNWKKVKQSDREKIMQHLDQYTLIEKDFRKDPERYLKHQAWNDEVILKQNKNGNLTRKESTPGEMFRS